MPKHYVGLEHRLPHEIKYRDLCIKRPLVTFGKSTIVVIQ